MALEPFPTFQKYQIEGILGQGSMGSVYKAQHKLLGRAVALKVPHKETMRHTLAKERFLREGRALAMLQHPHVVGVYDADEENDIPFIAMEYVEGPTLSQYIRQERQLSFSEVKRIAMQIAEALEYIHQKGILHRDLKSSNVLITSEGQARVTDFGIAQVDTQATITHGILGTPAYMSPEQAKGEPLDIRSDIYSLGVIMYEALTGRIPFVADNGLALIQQIIHQPPAPLETYRPEISSGLSSVVFKCMEKSRTARYASGSQLIRAIRQEEQATPQSESRPAFMAQLQTGVGHLRSLVSTCADWLHPRCKTLFADRPALIALAFVGILVLGLFLIVLSINGPTNDRTAVPGDSTSVEIDSSGSNWTPWPSR